MDGYGMPSYFHTRRFPDSNLPEALGEERKQMFFESRNLSTFCPERPSLSSMRENPAKADSRRVEVFQRITRLISKI
jgi:hypothetical protein